jgi:hypothetical protein
MQKIVLTLTTVSFIPKLGNIVFSHEKTIRTARVSFEDL